MPAPDARVPAQPAIVRSPSFAAELIVDLDRDLAVVRLTGDLDLDLTASLRDVLVSAVDSGAADVVVDLCGVRIIGSRSLGTLVVAARRAMDQGRRLHVAASHQPVIRAIELTGLSDFLRLTSSAEQVAGGTAGDG